MCGACVSDCFHVLQLARHARSLADPLSSVQCYHHGCVFCGLHRNSTGSSKSMMLPPLGRPRGLTNTCQSAPPGRPRGLTNTCQPAPPGRSSSLTNTCQSAPPGCRSGSSGWRCRDEGLRGISANKKVCVAAPLI
eukprot:5331616-Pyramimonas_sp.AAC.1